MKTRYQILMEIEVEVNSKTKLQSTNIVESLTSYAKEGFLGRAYIRDKAAVDKVEVSKIAETNEEATAEAALERASQMSKAELFLRELRAEDEDDYKVLSNRIAALVEELRMEAIEMSIYQLFELTNKIENRISVNKFWREELGLNADKIVPTKERSIDGSTEEPCDCGGEDENCSECDGTGYVI